ncbi:transporter [Comamonas sp. wu1-DMT]|uniref:SphA family protein n=1 Tax=Comamonas sp. wu1-DMT TaxID=3126390 RepID=UPI0032E4F0CC
MPNLHSKRQANQRTRLRPTGAGLVLAALHAAPSLAVENGSPITPPGVYDFGSGMLPPVSDVGAVAIRVVSTRATQLRDSAGNVSPVKPDLKVDAIVFAGMKMTDKDLLGGKYAYGVVVPVVANGSLGLRIPTPGGTLQQSGSNQGVGDVQLYPVVIQWKPAEGLFTNAGLMIQLPTGAYDKSRTFNAGANHWTIQPNFQFTYLTAGGLEFSGSTQVNFNGRNPATDYRSGVEVQQDFGIGQHAGDWTFGAAGYVYRQITDDKGPNVVDGNRARVNALGPAIGFFGPKRHLPLVYVHVYKEFGARNRVQGTQVAMRASWVF